MSLELMGLEPGALPDEVRQRFRHLASQAHPDKGGSVDAFAELQVWYAAALEEAALNAKKAAECERCGGTGRVMRGFGFQQVSVYCGHCGGSGQKPE